MECAASEMALAVKMLQGSLEICSMPSGPVSYIPAIQSDIERYNRVANLISMIKSGSSCRLEELRCIARKT